VPAKRDFTDRFLRAIRPAPSGKRTIAYDAQIPGFGVRVTDKGCRSFVLVARFGGANNPTARRIGSYPALSLAEARAIAREWQSDIDRGVDPKAKEAAARREQERQWANTFGAVFSSYVDDHLISLRSGRDVARTIEKHVLPHWGDLPISEIRRPHVHEVVRTLRKGAPIQANRLLSYLKKFFSWCLDEELIDQTPAASVKMPTKETRRDRVLSEREIAAIWQACGGLGPFGRAFRLMLATGARRSEVGKMTWGEIDFDAKIWTLPRERTKANRAHQLPLSNLALMILAECPRFGEYVFTTGGTRPIAGWNHAKARLDKLTGGEVAPWRLHDLRRTCATGLAKLGVDRVTIGKILNHSEPEVTATYDRFSYGPQKCQALDRWSEHLAAIVAGGSKPGNVIAIRQPR
jgi:integrase